MQPIIPSPKVRALLGGGGEHLNIQQPHGEGRFRRQRDPWWNPGFLVVVYNTMGQLCDVCMSHFFNPWSELQDLLDKIKGDTG